MTKKIEEINFIPELLSVFQGNALLMALMTRRYRHKKSFNASAICQDAERSLSKTENVNGLFFWRKSATIR